MKTPRNLFSFGTCKCRKSIVIKGYRYMGFDSEVVRFIEVCMLCGKEARIAQPWDELAELTESAEYFESTLDEPATLKWWK